MVLLTGCYYFQRLFGSTAVLTLLQHFHKKRKIQNVLFQLLYRSLFSLSLLFIFFPQFRGFRLNPIWMPGRVWLFQRSQRNWLTAGIDGFTTGLALQEFFRHFLFWTSRYLALHVRRTQELFSMPSHCLVFWHVLTAIWRSKSFRLFRLFSCLSWRFRSRFSTSQFW